MDCEIWQMVTGVSEEHTASIFMVEMKIVPYITSKHWADFIVL
jgi:hypothetical protein